jgi:hypothetical protein
MGLYSVCVLWRVKRVPICSCSWWLMSRGDGSGRPALPAMNQRTTELDEEDGGGTYGENNVDGEGSSSDLEMKNVSDGTTNLSAEVV